VTTSRGGHSHQLPGELPLVGARSLAELPEHRQAALVKRLRWWFPDVDDEFDDHITAIAGRPCRVPVPAPLPEVTAAHGDDGRYHLIIDAHLACGSGKVRRQLRVVDGRLAVTDAVFPHRQRCMWWTDGTRRLAQRPYAASVTDELFGSYDVAWIVRLTGAVGDPGRVHPRQRCAPTTSGALLSHWPPFTDATTAKGRIRARLIEVLGPACHACGGGRGVFIDHHHSSRLVRGLLCRHCNTHIDSCVHLGGCRWAIYLDHPPAGHLQLRYPS